MNRSIGITGPISEVNFGDYAMLVNNIYDIGAKDITVFSYNNNFSKTISKDYFEACDVKLAEVKLRTNKIDITKESEEKNKRKVGFLPFNHPTETPLDILYRVENLAELKDYVENIDVLVVNGGGYFNHLWNNSLWRSDMLVKIIVPMLIASQLNKEIIFTANGFGPFDQSEEFFCYLFAYLKNVSFAVRDRLHSSRYLKRLGIDENKIHFVPDDLYLINEELIGLPFYNKIKDINRKKYIVLEMYYSLDEVENYIEELRQFSENLHERYDISIVFMPFDFQRGGMWQGEYLSRNLDNFHLYDINVAGYLPIQDSYRIIRNSELVVCTRYHALVLALGAQVPVINTMKKVCDDHRYYFNKNYGVLEYVFEGLQFNEMDFLRVDLLDTLKHVQNNFLEIIKTQQVWYKSKEYNQNKERLKMVRKEYLEKIKCGG